MNEHQARQELEDIEMRRALLKLAWDEAHKDDRSPRPCPMMDDHFVRQNLRRILKIKPWWQFW